MSVRLVVIGSSSAGNSYALETDKEILLIEAGIPLRKVRQRTDLTKVKGVIVSHHHKDHAEWVESYSMRFPVAAPQEVLAKCMPFNAVSIYEGKTFDFGGFRSTPFIVPHSNANGTQCINAGYLIHHREMGTALFATDTYMLPYKFEHINHFILEANYSDEKLWEYVELGKTTPPQADRIELSHFSFENCIRTIQQCGTDSLKTVTLIHTSLRHGSHIQFERRAKEIFGVPCFAARQGLTFTLVNDIV